MWTDERDADGDDEPTDLDWTSEARRDALCQAEEAKRCHTPRLGIDFGNVIVAQEDGVFLRRAVDGSLEHCAPACAGARDGVRALVQLFKAEHVFIVSKARRRVAGLTMDWLETSDFLKDTGLCGDAQHVYFVNGREEKRPVVEALGITHFIDDRMTVLRSLTSCRQRVLMCGPWVQHDDRHDRGDRSAKALPGKVIVQSWTEAVGAIGKWFKGKNLVREESTKPSPAPCVYAERCAALEGELMQLQAYYDGLRQTLLSLEAHARQADALLQAREEESLMLRACFTFGWNVSDTSSNSSSPQGFAPLPLVPMPTTAPNTGATAQNPPYAAVPPGIQPGNAVHCVQGAPSASPCRFESVLPQAPPGNVLALASPKPPPRGPVCAPPSYPAPTATPAYQDAVPPDADVARGTTDTGPSVIFRTAR